MISEEDKRCIALEFPKYNIDWDKLDHRNQEEASKLSDAIYDLEARYGYDTTEIFLILVDRVYDNIRVMMQLLDADILEDVKDYISSLRKVDTRSETEKFFQ